MLPSVRLCEFSCMVCLRGTVGNWKQGPCSTSNKAQSRGRVVFTFWCSCVAPEGLTVTL